MVELSKDTKEFIIGVICVLLVMLLLYNLFIYIREHIITAYEGQIKLAQDSTLVDVIDGASVDIIENDETRIIRHKISSGEIYTVNGIYNVQGEILSSYIDTNRGIAIFGTLILGLILGMLLANIIIEILQADGII